MLEFAAALSSPGLCESPLCGSGDSHGCVSPTGRAGGANSQRRYSAELSKGSQTRHTFLACVWSPLVAPKT